MAYCSQCGALVEDGAAYCSQCGADQSASAVFNPYSFGANYNGAVSDVYIDPNAPIVPGFIEAIAICFRKYVDFRGRASRKEFWYWVLFWHLLVFVANACIIVFGLIGKPAVVVDSIIGFGLFLPYVSVFVRRLHDTNHTGWLWWLLAVPVSLSFILPFFEKSMNEDTALNLIGGVGFVTMVVFAYVFLLMIAPGDVGSNEYGLAPARVGEYEPLHRRKPRRAREIKRQEKLK